MGIFVKEEGQYGNQVDMDGNSQVLLRMIRREHNGLASTYEGDAGRECTEGGGQSARRECVLASLPVRRWPVMGWDEGGEERGRGIRWDGDGMVRARADVVLQIADGGRVTALQQAFGPDDA